MNPSVHTALNCRKVSQVLPLYNNPVFLQRHQRLVALAIRNGKECIYRSLVVHRDCLLRCLLKLIRKHFMGYRRFFAVLFTDYGYRHVSPVFGNQAAFPNPFDPKIPVLVVTPCDQFEWCPSLTRRIIVENDYFRNPCVNPAFTVWDEVVSAPGKASLSPIGHERSPSPSP